MKEEIKFFAIKRTNPNKEQWVDLKYGCPSRFFNFSTCITDDFDLVERRYKELFKTSKKNFDNFKTDTIDTFKIVELDLVEVQEVKK